MSYTNRKFGIEIEFVGASRRDVETALRGVGVDARVEGYNHETRPHWKIVSDASLNHHTGLMGEIVSPILQGADGFRQLKLVCDALATVAGITVNRSCGLHVHLDCREMTVGQIAKVFERYAAYEDQIDLVMPRSRRESARWCRSIKDRKDCMKRHATKNGQANEMGRYYKVNLTNVATRGAMEFRQHSGTVEYNKIANWTMFLMQFVEKSIELSAALPVATKNRWFAAIRNVFEANDYTVIWDRSQKAWVAVHVTGYTQAFNHDEMTALYKTGTTDYQMQKNGGDHIDPDAFGDLFSSMMGITRFDFNGRRMANVGVDELMAGVADNIKNYFEERKEELN
tara:strand:- start:473 stop:1495 length:1023 start_codon:yes stop_codon:yes gene_type:complete